VFHRHVLLRRALGDYQPAAVAAFGAHVDQPVGGPCGDASLLRSLGVGSKLVEHLLNALYHRREHLLALLQQFDLVLPAPVRDQLGTVEVEYGDVKPATLGKRDQLSVQILLNMRGNVVNGRMKEPSHTTWRFGALVIVAVVKVAAEARVHKVPVIVLTACR